MLTSRENIAKTFWKQEHRLFFSIQNIEQTSFSYRMFLFDHINIWNSFQSLQTIFTTTNSKYTCES